MVVRLPSRYKLPLFALSCLVSIHTINFALRSRPIPQEDHHLSVIRDPTAPPADSVLSSPPHDPTASPITAPNHASLSSSTGSRKHFKYHSLVDDQPIEEWSIPKDDIIRLKRKDWPVPARDQLDPDTKYISFLTHSGLSLINALTLAKLTNRTLLIPQITLGSAVAWVPPPLLQEHIEQAEKTDIHDCRSTRVEERKAKCGLFWKSRRASWSWLLGPRGLTSRQPLIERYTHDRTWFQTALNIQPHEIITMPDPDRRSYRVIDTDEPDTPNSLASPYQYSVDLTLDDLREMDHYKLLEFGSLFGGTRLRLRREENWRFYEETKREMRFRDPMLDRFSEVIVDKLGGRGQYVGLHLRLGAHNDFVHSMDAFFDEAPQRTEFVFRQLCSEQYGLDDATISSLVARNRRIVAAVKPAVRKSQELSFITPSLACPSPLYDESDRLAPLNTPLYIATDTLTPRSDSLVTMFIETFPCVFFLSDFQQTSNFHTEAVPEMEFLERATDEEGERLRPFLEPFLEGLIVAKSKGVVGTPKSTFSTFVKTILHEAYMPNDGDEDHSSYKPPLGASSPQQQLQQA
ncbi:hypothetical protein T439DRAFT_378973 [Meredithblackwellia eburnea MCA 4105]